MVLRATFKPGQDLAEMAGVTLTLEAVELRTTELVLVVCGQRSHVTDELDATHAAAVDEWTAVVSEAKRDGLKPPPPPSQPGELLNGLAMTVSDDVGTTYRWKSRAVAGTGTEWRSEWHYEPAVPTAATRLTVQVTDTDEEDRAHQFTLPDR